MLRTGGRSRLRIAKKAPFSRLEELRQLLAKHAVSLLCDPQTGIRCLAIGRKSGGALRPGEPVEDLCITAYVDEKRPRGQLREGASVAAAFSSAALGGKEETPGGLALADIIDVVECGSAFRTRPALRVPAIHRGSYGGRAPSIDLQKPHRALRGGLGVTNPHMAYPSLLSVGTLGFFVADTSGAFHLVSNNHVIGDSNGALKGEPVVQPGTLDLTDSELKIYATEADLVRFFGVAAVSAVVPLRYADAQNVPLNDVDAAMARLDVKVGGFPRETNDLARQASVTGVTAGAPS